MVRAFALQSVYLMFISQVEPYRKTLKNGIHSFPAQPSAHKDSEEIKPASLLVVSLDEMPPFSCGSQVAGPSSLSVVVVQTN